MAEKIMTLHPQGKQGVNISKEKYDTVRQAIVDSLADQGEMSFWDLVEDVNRKLAGSFDGSVNWYVTTVKLDLEARGRVKRLADRSPQRLRLVPG
jgi:hypothetical protein